MAIKRYQLIIIFILLFNTSLASAQQNKFKVKTPAKVDSLWQILTEPWSKVTIEPYRATKDILLRLSEEKKLGINYRIIYSSPRPKVLLLTFDDGPHPKYTLKILSILKQFHIPATFFVVGKMVEQYPELLKEEVKAGHIIGNHTYNHLNLTSLDLRGVNQEYQKCNDIINKISNLWPIYCRPPGGDYNATVMQAADEQNLVTVLWTDDPGDYASPGDKLITSRTLAQVHNGGIILLHDGIDQTIEILPALIEALLAKGFVFQTPTDFEHEMAWNRNLKNK